MDRSSPVLKGNLVSYNWYSETWNYYVARTSPMNFNKNNGGTNKGTMRIFGLWNHREGKYLQGSITLENDFSRYIDGNWSMVKNERPQTMKRNGWSHGSFIYRVKPARRALIMHDVAELRPLGFMVPRTRNILHNSSRGVENNAPERIYTGRSSLLDIIHIHCR